MRSHLLIYLKIHRRTSQHFYTEITRGQFIVYQAPSNYRCIYYLSFIKFASIKVNTYFYCLSLLICSYIIRKCYPINYSPIFNWYPEMSVTYFGIGLKYLFEFIEIIYCGFWKMYYNFRQYYCTMFLIVYNVGDIN